MKPNETTAQRLREAILQGRKPVTKPASAPTAAPDASSAKATLTAFADTLQRLHAAREAMDSAAAAVEAGRSADLAALVQSGQALPKLGTLAATAQDSQVEAAALKAFADTQTASAGAAVAFLVTHGRKRIEIVEVYFRAANPIPSWMDPATAESAIRSLPEWGDLLAMREKLTAGSRPAIPAVRADGQGFNVRLRDYRTAPLSAFQKKIGYRDEWNPARLAEDLRRFLATVEEIEDRAREAERPHNVKPE